MRITITIDDPTPEVLEWLRPLLGALRTARPADPAESGHPDPDPDPDAPKTGRELLGWASKHHRKDEAVAVARRLHFGTKLVALTDDQAGQIYAEMRQGKPAKGSQHWGGAANHGHVGPK
jgi:hypothetical protein